MFAIERKTENGFNKIILQDLANNTSAEVIPNCGAILHSFSFINNGKLQNIIVNYSDIEDYRKNVASKGFRSCKLSPFACRIKNAEYSFGGVKYKLDKFLLNENALHGLLYDTAFEIIAEQVNEEAASVVLQYRYDGNENGFPFQYDCIVTYELKKANALKISTEIINKSGGLMPVQDGWHPYFTFGGSINDLQLEFKAKEKVEMDDRLIPTGKLLGYGRFNTLSLINNTAFDDCFTLNFGECQPMCVIRNAAEKVQVEISPSNSYAYLQIYTPGGRKSIAIENLSAAPDAFNNSMGLIILANNETASFDTTYKITLLP